MRFRMVSRLFFCCLIGFGLACAEETPRPAPPLGLGSTPVSSLGTAPPPTPVAANSQYSGSSARATLVVKPDNPEVAAPFVLTLEVQVPRGTVVQLPGASAPIYPFDLIAYASSESVKDGNVRIEGRYTLFGSLPGKQQLGPLQVGLKLADGTEHQLLAGPVSFELKSLLASRSEPLKDILPIKGPLPFPEPVHGFPWLLASSLVLAVLLTILFVLWLRRRSSNRRPPPEPAHVLALRRLQELGRRELDSPGSVEPFYVGLSEILRRYLESRFGVPVMEQTTQEIKRAFDPAVHGPNWTFRLYQLLERMDLVKFARFRISASAAFEDLQVARALVEELVERDSRAADENARSQKLDSAGAPAPGGGS